jgi:hypothetical protein
MDVGVRNVRSFAALKKLDDAVNISRACGRIRNNVSISAKIT